MNSEQLDELERMLRARDPDGWRGICTDAADAIATLRAQLAAPREDAARELAAPLPEEVEAMAKTAIGCCAVEPTGQAIAAMLRSLARQVAEKDVEAKKLRDLINMDLPCAEG